MSFEQISGLLIFEVSCFTGVDVVRTAVGFFAWPSVNVRMMKKVSHLQFPTKDTMLDRIINSIV